MEELPGSNQWTKKKKKSAIFDRRILEPVEDDEESGKPTTAKGEERKQEDRKIPPFISSGESLLGKECEEDDEDTQSECSWSASHVLDPGYSSGEFVNNIPVNHSMTHISPLIFFKGNCKLKISDALFDHFEVPKFYAIN